MKRYDEYKQTGTPWIGEIPSHWESKRLRFICEFRNGYTPSKANPYFWTDGTIPWYRMEDIRDSGRRLNEAKQYVTEEAVKGGGLFEAWSFILATTATIGEHAVLIVDSLANQQFTNLKIRKSLFKEVDNEFFFYFLFVIDDYCKSTTKTATFAAVNIDDLKNFEVAIPPFEEQLKIVSYINKVIQSYDKVISTQERRIALLEELKQSVITEAATHGINPDAKLRPSGIDWIGNIPEHWQKCRIKNFVTLITKPSTSDVKIGLENIESNSGRYIETESEFEGNGVEFHKCDIVYGKLRPYLRKVWKATFSGNAVGDFYVFRCKRNSNPSYLHYLLLSDGFTKIANSSTFGAKMPRVASDFILSMHYFLPPLTEQQEIVEYIDSKIKPIDASIAKAKREIELLKELKQSVITEAVTGKIKVC